MIDCQDRPGESLTLKNSRIRESCSGVEWASLVMDAMKELEHIFKPVTADLALYCYSKGSEFENWDIRPMKPFWQLRELGIPERIYTESDFAEQDTVIDVPQINQDSILTWIKNALKQESPKPDTDIVEVKSINFHAVRARIIEDKLFQNRDTFVVDHLRMGKYEYPLKRINGELWVYSPLPEVFSKPSFKVRTDRYTGTFDLEIYWDWWTRTSAKDKDALEQALMNIINKSQWKLDFIVKYLEMPRLRSLAEQLNKPPIPKEQLNTEKIALNGKTEPIQIPEPPVPEPPNLEQQQQEKQERLELVKTRLAKIDIEKKRLNERIKNLSGGSYDRALHTRIKELKAKLSKLSGEKSKLEREKTKLEQEIEKINQDIA